MEILQLFEQLDIDTISKSLYHPERDILHIDVLFNEKKNYDTNTLYIWNSKSKLTNASQSNFIIVQNVVTIPMKKENNIIIIEEEKLEAIEELVRYELEKEQIIMKAKERLFSEMLKQEELTVSSLLKTAYELLGNPVILTNSTFRLIELFPKQTLKDPVWDTLHSQGYLEHDYIMLFEADTTRKKTLESNKPIYLNWSWAEKFPRISGIIIDGKKVFGYLGVMEYHRRFTKADFEITELLCKMFCHILKRKDVPSSDSRILQQTFLANLLDGGITNEESLSQAKKNLHMQLLPPYCIAIIPLTITETENSRLNQIYDQLYKKIEYMYTINHSGNLILFLQGEKINHSVKMVHTLLTKYKFPYSISPTYNNLLDTSIFFRQGKIAYEIGKEKDPQKKPYKYSNYVHLHVISSAVAKEGEDVFLFPGIRKLITYDLENKTQYAATLRAYLSEFKNATETAKELDIHRNTLNYRLNKCEEILGINLSNNTQCQHIQLSLEVLLR